MHQLIFYPLGNADSTLISLENGKNILFDYADMGDKKDDEDLRIDLPSELDQAVEGEFDIVASFFPLIII